MKITNTTPPPPKKTYNIELNENELKLLGVILAESEPGSIHESIRCGVIHSDFRGVEWIPGCTSAFYQYIREALK